MAKKMETKSPLFLRSVRLIKKIPKGKVLTYAEVASLIGAKGCARHVSYILSSSSSKYDLPWHRVLNSKGMISLAVGSGYFEQKKLLEREGVLFVGQKIDLKTYLWKPTDKTITRLMGKLPKHIPAHAR